MIKEKGKRGVPAEAHAKSPCTASQNSLDFASAYYASTSGTLAPEFGYDGSFHPQPADDQFFCGGPKFFVFRHLQKLGVPTDSFALTSMEAAGVY